MTRAPVRAGTSWWLGQVRPDSGPLGSRLRAGIRWWSSKPPASHPCTALATNSGPLSEREYPPNPPYPPQETTENSMDMAHLRCVHGYLDASRVGPTTFDGAGLRSRFDFKRSKRILGLEENVYEATRRSSVSRHRGGSANAGRASWWRGYGTGSRRTTRCSRSIGMTTRSLRRRVSSERTIPASEASGPHAAGPGVAGIGFPDPRASAWVYGQGGQVTKRWRKPLTHAACSTATIPGHAAGSPLWMEIHIMHWFYWIPAFAGMTASRVG